MNRSLATRAAVLAIGAVLVVGGNAGLAVTKTQTIVVSGVNATVRSARHAIASDGALIYVAYVEAGEVRLRRSTNAGVSFEPAITMRDATAIAVSEASVAAAHGVAHVAWVEAGGDGKQRVMYRRSPDAGATWAAAIPLSGPSTKISSAELYASGDRVFLAYVDSTAARMNVVRSGNLGATFAGPALLGASDVAANVSMAFGAQVIYIAWTSPAGDIRLRRSTTGGSTWRPAVTLASHRLGVTYFWPWIAATGRYAIVTATRGTDLDDAVVLRRTADRGASWAAIQRVGKPAYLANFYQTAFRANGRWWMTVDQCPPVSCEAADLRLLSSPDAVHWTGHGYLGGGGLVGPGGVTKTFDGTIWYAWQGDTWNGGGDDERVNVRGVR